VRPLLVDRHDRARHGAVDDDGRAEQRADFAAGFGFEARYVRRAPGRRALHRGVVDDLAPRAVVHGGRRQAQAHRRRCPRMRHHQLLTSVGIVGVGVGIVGLQHEHVLRVQQEMRRVQQPVEGPVRGLAGRQVRAQGEEGARPFQLTRQRARRVPQRRGIAVGA
jgi:hypothetical protein